MLLHFSADEDTLRQRIRVRQDSGRDPSEAGVEVLEAQLRSQEPLVSDERVHTVMIETSCEPSVSYLALRIAGKISSFGDALD